MAATRHERIFLTNAEGSSIDVIAKIEAWSKNLTEKGVLMNRKLL